MIPRPTFDEEKILWNKNIPYVIGVDEVGRGAFAGPVVVGAAIFSPCFCNDSVQCDRCETEELKLINDSKLLQPAMREKLSVFLKKHLIAYSIEETSVEVINKVGIGKATQLAFVNAVLSIKKKVLGIENNSNTILDTSYLIPDTNFHVLVDGLPIDGISNDFQKPIIKGDQKSITIAAASIIAKVYRDKLMEQLSEEYRIYNFGKHKGYGTKEHRLAIKQYGLSDLHRTSFNLEKFL